MFTEVHCVITGKVQGVGFRAYVERVATERGVTGWVHNRDDGAVEVLLQGIPDVLKECIEDLHEGSVLARVDGVGVDWRTPREHFDEFKVIAHI
jgi:acylphosphatase